MQIILGLFCLHVVKLLYRRGTFCNKQTLSAVNKLHHHHHHHVHECLGVFPVPWSSRCSWSLHLFLGRPIFLCPFGLYCSVCFGGLFLSILSKCYSHFSWYCFVSFTVFLLPFFSRIHWFFSLSSFVIPSKCLIIFICADSKRCYSLFFSTQASLPNFSAALAVMLWINFLPRNACTVPQWNATIGAYLCKLLKLDHLGKWIRNTPESAKKWCTKRVKVSWTHL